VTYGIIQLKTWPKARMLRRFETYFNSAVTDVAYLNDTLLSCNCR